MKLCLKISLGAGSLAGPRIQHVTSISPQTPRVVPLAALRLTLQGRILAPPQYDSGIRLRSLPVSIRHSWYLPSPAQSSVRNLNCTVWPAILALIILLSAVPATGTTGIAG